MGTPPDDLRANDAAVPRQDDSGEPSVPAGEPGEGRAHAAPAHVPPAGASAKADGAVEGSKNAEAESSAASTGHDASAPVVRHEASTPPGGGQRPVRFRMLYAYGVTFLVVGSYLWLRVARMWRSDKMHERKMRRAHMRNARRVERGIQRLQGLFIKVGQLFSVLTNFLPEEFRRHLEGLQDAVPPRPFEHIRARIERELGRPLEQLFASFDARALASASLGQVHEAVLHDGRKVAVKVQYPGVERLVDQDLRTLRTIVRIVHFFFPVQNLRPVYREVERMVLRELDYHQEAENLRTIRANFGDDERVALPEVIDELSTSRVLTATFMEGTKLMRLARDATRREFRTEVARRLVEVYATQIFEHGFYHADPHPGNILVTDEGRIILLDFGATAELSASMRRGIAFFLQGVLTADTDRIVQALHIMGFVQRGQAEDVIEQLVVVLHNRIQQAVRIDTLQLDDIRIDPEAVFEVLLDLRRLDLGLRRLADVFHIPSQWILLERTVVMLTGVCASLDPELRPMTLLRPYVERMLAEEGQDWSTVVIETARRLGGQLLTLPGELNKVLQRTARGQLKVASPDSLRAARRVQAAARQVAWAVLAGVSLGVATAWDLHGAAATAHTWYIVAGALGGLFALSVLRHR